MQDILIKKRWEGEMIKTNYVTHKKFSRQIANPTAMILCCSNLLNHLHLNDYARALRLAVEKVIRDGKVKTRDLGGYAYTKDFVAAVIDNFRL